MKTINYNQAVNLKHLTLDDLYNNFSSIEGYLSENIKNVIETEAPVTLNTLKARMREVFDVAKISGKALEFIMNEIAKSGYVLKDEIYDTVIWPSSGVFKVDYLRINSNRLIYDIPPVELKNLVNELNLSGEELYRAILKYFGLEVLTKKAREYLEYVEKY
jgi:hypothetical protein